MMLSAAHALMRRFRRTAVAESVAGAVRPRVRMRVEEIEPRVLYSADFAPAVVDQPGTQVQMRVVETAPAQPAATQEVVSRELVVVDIATPDYQALVDGIVAQTDSARTFEILLIDGASDGIAQITDALSAMRDIDGVHVISHGSDGAIRLGSSVLDIDSLTARAAEIGMWGGAFAEQGDLLIYGCDVAGSADGRLLIDALARLTGADVAASEDTTGNAALGGDWLLEYRAGQIDTRSVQSSWAGVLASVPAGAETRVNSTVSPTQTGAAVAMNSAGSYVIVWTSDNSDGDGTGIYAQRYDAAGNTVGGEFRVNTTTVLDQTRPAVAMDSSGKFVVVWASKDQDGDKFGIYGQRYDASGVAQGAEFQVHQSTTGEQDRPAVGMDANGNFVVTWQSKHTGSYEIYARRFDAAGAALTAEFGVNTATANDQNMSAMAMNATGQFVIAWKTTNPVDGSGSGVLAQLYDAAGVPVGGEFQVNTTSSGSQDKPAAAMAQDGSFVIAWVSGNNQDGDRNGVYAQRFSAAGVKQGSEFRVNTATVDNQDLPSAAIDGSGNFTIVWQSANQDGGGKGIYFQNYDASGFALGSETLANATTANNQNEPAIAMRGSGDFVVAWSGNGPGDSAGIFAQRFLNQNAAPVNTVPGAQETSGVAPLVFSAANGNRISIADVDAGLNVVRVSLTATNGTLSLNGTAGLVFSVGDGTADAVMTFTGTLPAINGALDGLSFAATPFFSGAASLQVTSNDLGNAGAGGALADSDTVAISVAQIGTPSAISGSYVGNAVDNRAISGVGFQPDVVIIKVRDDNKIAAIRTSVMTGDISKELVGAVAVRADEVQSLDGDGFTVGTNDTVNKLGKTYDWIAFKASPGWMKVGTYSGDGVAGRSMSGVGFSPEAVFVFDQDNKEAVFRLAGDAGETYDFNVGNGNAAWITSLDADGFSLGSDARVNGAGRTYYYVAWNAIPGAMDIGNYTGNGADNRNITGVGFQPEWMMVKSAEGDGAYQHFGSQEGVDSSLPFGGNAAVANRIQALQPDGFQVGSDPDVNANGRLYSYLAFRQQTAPTISDVGALTIDEDTPSAPIAFTVGDQETAAGNLQIRVTSSAPALVPDGNIVLSGSGADRTLTITPVANQSGTATITIEVTDGGASATDTFILTVAAVNDAPVGTSNTVVTAEDTPLLLNAAAFGFTDPNDTPANNFAAVRIASLPIAGTLTLSGLAVTAGQSVSAADIAAGNLVFTPAANGAGANYATFTFQVQDDGGGANVDTVARILNIDVTPVNDAPVGTATTVVAIEDTPFVFTAANFGYTDPADTPANSLLAVRITSLPAAGALTLNGVAVAAGQSISVADINAGNLVFTAAANANGAGYASFTFRVQDDGGGANLDTVARTLTINVTPVNDAPAGTNNTLVTNEDTPLVFNAAAFGFSEPIDAPANNLGGVMISSLPIAGALTLSGVAVTAGQVVSGADIDAGNFAFTPGVNANGAGCASFTFQVQDDGGTANGGVNLDTTARTMMIDVTSVNDRPVGTNKTVTMLEDSALAFSTTDFGFTDPADAPANNLLSVRLSSLPTAGALTLNGAAVASGDFISAADIAAGGIVFRPTANAGGVGYASFTFQVRDDGGQGTDLDSVARTMTIDVAGVNDAPVGANNTVTANEDVTFAFSAAAFGLSDPDDTPADNLAAVRITALPTAGSLRLSGVAVTAGQAISVADINAGQLTFRAAADAYGVGYANFTFRVQDDGGTANGGADTDALARTMTINVTSINDAPAGTDNAVTTLEDTAFTFSTAMFGFRDAADVPANNFLAVTITSLPTAGTLMLNGVAVSAGQSVNVSDIAAGGLVFTPGANGNGAAYASFTFRVQDNGGTANAGTDLDAVARTMTVAVTPVNDPPVGADATIAMPMNAQYTFSASSFGFSDAADQPSADSLAGVWITSMPASGSLSLNSTLLSTGQFVIAADISAGRFVYAPARDATGTAIANFTFKVQDTGIGANVALVESRITFDVIAPPPVPTVPQTVDASAVAPTTTTQTTTTTTSTSTSTSTATSATDARVDASTQIVAPAAPREAEVNVGATTEPPRANTGFVQVALQRVDAQQPNRDTRSATIAAVQEAQVVALVTDRASDTSSPFASAQTRTSEAALAPTAQNRAMFNQMDQMREELRHETKMEATAIAATAATSVSLSVGYVIWLLRGGALVSTLLSSVPAWRFVDPLPVLGNTDGADGDDDDDSLESLVSQNDGADEAIPATAEAPAARETATT